MFKEKECRHRVENCLHAGTLAVLNKLQMFSIKKKRKKERTAPPDKSCMVLGEVFNLSLNLQFFICKQQC